MRDARRPGVDTIAVSTRAEPVHEAFSRTLDDGFRADVARRAFRNVFRACFDSLRDGLVVFLVRVIFLSTAGALDALAQGSIVAARVPVLRLALRPAIARVALATSWGSVWNGNSARGAGREDSWGHWIDE